MYELMNNHDIMLDIAQKIKAKRIALNFTQEELSSKTGITLSTYRTFENKGKGSFQNFLTIVSFLGASSELENLLLPAPFSPAEAFRQEPFKERIRVKKSNTLSKPSSQKRNNTSSLLKVIHEKK